MPDRPPVARWVPGCPRASRLAWPRPARPSQLCEGLAMCAPSSYGGAVHGLRLSTGHGSRT
eukprot:10324243-Alexandrium_andersonii.AAC.1